MAGALAELRRAIIAKEEIDVDGTSVIIGSSVHLNRSEPTNFHSMRGRGDPYLLEAIFFQFKFRDMPYNDYVQACRRERVAHVTPLDKKDLIAYLTGEISTCASIVSKSSDSPVLLAKPEKVPASSSKVGEVDDVKQKHERGARRSGSEVDGERLSYASQRKRDREQRALDSVLMVAELDFSTLREKVSQYLTNAKAGKTKKTENGSKPQPAYDPRGDRYTNNEGRFWRENLGGEFQELGIDMSGSFKAKPTANEDKKPVEKPREKRDSHPGATKEPLPKRPRVDLKELVPIIIVPAGSTLIFAGNAVDFFQHGRFLSMDELKKRKSTLGTVGVSRATAMRTPGGNCSRAEYLIVSNPNRLTVDEWDRVVAVVLSGQEWQFKNWPINDKGTQELFRRIQGFYFHYDDVSTTGNIEAWAVKKLSLSRSRRHTDGQVLVQFWNTLDTFLRRKSKHLRY